MFVSDNPSLVESSSPKTYQLHVPTKTFPSHLPGLTQLHSVPRTYPPRFALRISKHLQRFCSRRVALNPLMGDGVARVATEQILTDLPWDQQDQWLDAELASVLFYLRGSKSLELGTWRNLFPDDILI